MEAATHLSVGRAPPPSMALNWIGFLWPQTARRRCASRCLNVPAIPSESHHSAASAVDREFYYKCWLKFGWREAGGLRPPTPSCILGGCAPQTPCIPGGPAPQTPQKALCALCCSGWSLLS